MSGASPKHTKSRRYKACLGATQTAVTQRGKGVWEAGPTWVRQDACPETYSQDSCCGHCLSPADVQTTPSTGGRGAPLPQGQADRSSCPRPASRDKLQTSSGSYELLLIWPASAEHRPHVLNAPATRQEIPEAEVRGSPRHHSGSEIGRQPSQEP